jgi:hypothetical protein
MTEPNDRRQWFAVENNFFDNPKILEVGVLGAYAHLRAIAYSSRHATDGFLPEGAAWRIMHDDVDMDEANPDLEASMVQANLWHPVSGGYMLHDYLKHQTSALTMREKRAKAGRLGGLASAKQRASKTQASKLEVEVEKDLTPLPQPSTYTPEGAGVENGQHQQLPDLNRVLKDMPL